MGLRSSEGLRDARGGCGATSLRLSLGELTPGDLQTAYEWSHAQEDAIYRLIRYFHEEWIVRVGEEQDVASLAEDLGVATSTMQVIQRRAQRILDMPCISRDPSQPSLSARIVDELMDGFSVLVDTSGLSSMEEILVASVITRTVLDAYANLYLDDRDRFAALPPTLVALEEAQRVLSRVARSDENVFPRLAREGRKFKVGLCAVSQQPKLIDDELSRSSTRSSSSAWPTRRTATSCGAAPSRTSPTWVPRSRR